MIDSKAIQEIEEALDEYNKHRNSGLMNGPMLADFYSVKILSKLPLLLSALREKEEELRKWQTGELLHWQKMKEIIEDAFKQALSKEIRNE